MLHGDDVDARTDAGTAISNRSVGRVTRFPSCAEGLEVGAQLVGLQQAAVGAEHGRPGRAAGTGHVAGAGVDERLLAGETLVGTGIQHGATRGGERRCFVGGSEPIGGPRLGGERRWRGRVAGAGFQFEAGEQPGLEPAIEHRRVATEHAQHDHEPAGGEATGVVVRHHHRVVADAQLTHCGGEIFWRG